MPKQSKQSKKGKNKGIFMKKQIKNKSGYGW